jgi:hypothetical protein
MGGEEVYEGGGSFYGEWDFGEFSWICTERGEFEFDSRIGSVQGAPVCWRFWARGPGYPYDILELGSCPSWQGGTRFGQCLIQFNNEQPDRRRN